MPTSLEVTREDRHHSRYAKQPLLDCLSDSFSGTTTASSPEQSNGCANQGSGEAAMGTKCDN